MSDENIHPHSQLQNALETNLRHYQRFLHTDHGDDPKRVTAFHTAGKSIVTHMAALMKLLKLFDKNHHRKDKDADLENLLRQARNILSMDGHDQENQF